MKMTKRKGDKQKYAERGGSESASPARGVKHVVSLRSRGFKSLKCGDEINHTSKHSLTPTHTRAIRPSNLNAA